jgi:hypothetical protein
LLAEAPRPASEAVEIGDSPRSRADPATTDATRSFAKVALVCCTASCSLQTAACGYDSTRSGTKRGQIADTAASGTRRAIGAPGRVTGALARAPGSYAKPRLPGSQGYLIHSNSPYGRAGNTELTTAKLLNRRLLGQDNPWVNGK